jgi:hypothetical protein
LINYLALSLNGRLLNSDRKRVQICEAKGVVEAQGFGAGVRRKYGGEGEEWAHCTSPP